MVGTVTFERKQAGPRQRIVFDWVSDASGNADITTGAKLTGAAVLGIFIPDTVDVPTTLYDVTITDEDGVDVLQNQGLNRSVAVIEEQAVSFGNVFNSTLKLNVSNAGNAKKGKVILEMEY